MVVKAKLTLAKRLLFNHIQELQQVQLEQRKVIYKAILDMDKEIFSTHYVDG